MIKVGDFEYELIENFRECFDKDEFIELFTEYFHDFDYIVGDYAYNKLRLKGFYEDSNKKAKQFNKISGKDNYLKNNCAYSCRYFVLKKI